MEREKVGEVFHFFGKISVAAVRLTDGGLSIGDTIQIQGPTTNLQQTVDTLQIEHANVQQADRGQEVGMKVRDRVREKDFVYKILQPEVPTRPKAPAKPAAAKRKAPTKRKAPVKKAVRRAVKKATRAKRKTARRGSRKSRSRSR